MQNGTNIAVSLTPDIGVARVRPTGERPRTTKALRDMLSLNDFERIARRRLPRSIFGFVEGGTESEAALSGNRKAFEDWALVPRGLVDVSARSQTQALFGIPYAAPFGIAPMGAALLAASNADLVLARAAQRAGIPFILSGLSLISLEEVAQAAPDAWFQAYVHGNRDMITGLLARAARAGFGTLVITIDNCIPANRENNVRNGFTIPLRPSLRLAWEGVTHPRWLKEVLFRTVRRRGLPYYENTGPQRGAPVLSRKAARSIQDRDRMSWDHFKLIRDLWKGRLVVKGVVAPDDAQRAASAGADGVIVSNHGGRQMDHCVATLDALPAVERASGNMVVMLDGGVRRGTDVIKALALGASYVFVGRPFLYAAAVDGENGVVHAISLLSEEIDRDIGLLGVTSLQAIGTHHLVRRGERL